MMNFQEIFEDNYQFYLKEIAYNTIVYGDKIDKLDVNIKDDLSHSLNRDTDSFDFEIKRTVSFAPNALYRLSVTFGARLKIRESAPELSDINWDEELKNNAICIGLIHGLLTRISVLISQITASYGQNPLVTPPKLIK